MGHTSHFLVDLTFLPPTMLPNMKLVYRVTSSPRLKGERVGGVWWLSIDNLLDLE